MAVVVVAAALALGGCGGSMSGGDAMMKKDAGMMGKEGSMQDGGMMKKDGMMKEGDSMKKDGGAMEKTR
jgi:hypothetical protein